MELNPSQQIFVTNNEIKDCILNGPPGTGKTNVIKEFIQYNIEKDILDKNSVLLFAFNTSSVTDIKKKCDFINKLWFDCRISASNSSSLTSNDYFTWTRNTGAAYIKDYSLQIGQQIIDKQDSDFLNIYSEIYDPFNDSWSGLNKSVARDKVYYNQEFSINHAGMNPNGYLQLYIDFSSGFLLIHIDNEPGSSESSSINGTVSPNNVCIIGLNPLS